MSEKVSSDSMCNKKRRERLLGDGWQAEKSHITRTMILEATMACLIEVGYSNTTTEKIANRAGVSRGAMTHHFKSRADIFFAAAAYITDIRVCEYDLALSEVIDTQGSFPTFEGMRKTLSVLQQYYMEPTFIAYQELVSSSRTDEMLAQAMKPLQESLDQRILESMVTRFPIWSKAGMTRTGEVLRDLIMHSLQGVASDPESYSNKQRLDSLHAFLANIAIDAFTKAYLQVGKAGIE